jgi:hypothetical protein
MIDKGGIHERLHPPLTPNVDSLCPGFYRSDSGQTYPRCRGVSGLLPDLRKSLSILLEQLHNPGL